MTKAELRAELRARRSALSEAAYAEKSAAIVARILALPEIERAKTVHAYWPLTKRREVDTRPLIDALAEAGTRVVLPVVERGGEAPQMRHLLYTGRRALRKGPWGLREPAGSKAVPPAELDAVIVPAFGAGRDGHRIGHGAGFYDAFLRGLRAPTVCPVYAKCYLGRVPAEAHDVPVSIVVTEDGVHRIR